jgi:hypothetical protein
MGSTTGGALGECDICELSNYFDDGQFDAVVVGGLSSL